MRHLSLLLCLPALLSAAQPTIREMSLTTPDGYVLKGTLSIPAQPGPRPVVILAHGFGSDRNGWKRLPGLVNDKGIATLVMDLRGHGRSTEKGGQTVAIGSDFVLSSQAVGFDKIPGDLTPAAAWVRKQPGIDPRRIGLAGSSLGAYASLMAGPAIHPVAILAVSPAGRISFGEGALPRLVQAVDQTHGVFPVRLPDLSRGT